jgi:hypothetical protein
MDYDLLTADQLRAEARMARQRAEETARKYSWSAQQTDSKRPIPIPINDVTGIDWEEVTLNRRRAEARKTLGAALQESGLPQKWAKQETAEREMADYFNSMEGSGALGRMLSNKR